MEERKKKVTRIKLIDIFLYCNTQSGQNIYLLGENGEDRKKITMTGAQVRFWPACCNIIILLTHSLMFPSFSVSY